MGGLLWVACRILPPDRIAGWSGAGLLTILIGTAVAFYWFAAHLLGAPEPAELRRLVRRRRG